MRVKAERGWAPRPRCEKNCVTKAAPASSEMAQSVCAVDVAGDPECEWETQEAHARRLKTLRGLTPAECILDAWAKEPDRFRIDPSHLIPGPYT